MPTIQKIVIVVAAIGCGFTGSGQTKILDSIKAEINKHPQRDTVRVRLITDYARAALNGNTSQLLPYLNEVISISKEQQYRKGLQAAYHYKQIYYSDRDDAENAKAYADMAFMYLQKDTSRFAITTLAWLHNNVAGDYAKLADYQQAVDHLTKAATIFEKSDPKALPSIYGNIAIMYAHLLLPERAMEYDRKAIAAAEKSGDSLSFARRNIGYVSRLLDAENFKEASKTLDKIEPIVRRLDNNTTYIFFIRTGDSSINKRSDIMKQSVI
ncbi:tetratricopeptide repeat protein [Niabella hibiscisoli]|uniref:tetratricopeptide repeat protein n=1 Tax=Niabella hibiscisoli TaxID=1825928 RepID=UPI001F0E277C|nr:tetratricopeptide repeat protein [Niabella hibiscisoli]MCH5717728.1 tetratricopeptide repeat protein [Niabella hibiscisoli]